MASRLRGSAHPHTASPFALQLINKEEELLEKEKSTFPLLQMVMTNKVPYEQLWVTTYEFSTKSEEWMNGETLPLRGGWGWVMEPALQQSLNFRFWLSCAPGPGTQE